MVVNAVATHFAGDWGFDARIIVSYDESDNVTLSNCRISDTILIDNLIDMQPACWQQYIDRDGRNFKIFAFPLK